MEFINRGQGRKSEIFKRSRDAQPSWEADWMIKEKCHIWTQLTLASVSSRSSVDRAPAPGIREVMGSIAVGDPNFFFVSCLCPCDMLICSLFTMYFCVFFSLKMNWMLPGIVDQKNLSLVQELLKVRKEPNRKIDFCQTFFILLAKV